MAFEQGTGGPNGPIDMQALIGQVAGQAGPQPAGDPMAGAYNQPRPIQTIDPQAVAQAYHNALAQLMGRKRRPTGRKP
jgi:hypothetical protein